MKLLFNTWILFSLIACNQAYLQSIGGESTQVFEKIYATDFNTAWQSILDALKNSRLDITNREGGLIQTKWTDNTAEKNFSDSFGSADVYLKAQYRFRISVAKGFYNGIPTIKVNVQKEQIVQRDVLEDFRPLSTDSIGETTLLYRIGRIIDIRMKLARLEADKTKQALEKSGFSNESLPEQESVFEE